ncbi:MAG: zinc ribbon domain-containing protein [Clostridia bacterium]|nr:zinc ribbon domain-containing protein [Clostridia bacterium]
MICKNCGYQIADGSAFCINCGATVEAQPQQAQYQQQPQYAAPQYAPQPQYIVQQQFVYEPPMSREYTEYLDDAGSAMSRSITGLILTLVLPVVGFLIGFIMSLTVKGTLGRLKRREINEDELYTQKSREDYAAAKRKAKTASIISTINLILILLPVFIGVFLGLLAATGILYEMY